ncbi:unnamed protein product [Gongylonema pulchrum]|uniref:Uncharacterized protein n=1 Tax=Gongylonema pulchrum TaxID=637853 RepID=A0A183E735_9BILA|nr:unnamed protein product [Gongylonema pulchrum]
MHLKKVSSSLKRKLAKQSEKARRKRPPPKIRKASGSSEKIDDETLPKKYQELSSSDESSWSDCDPSSSSSQNPRSSTPFAFRSDRYTSDVSESDSDPDPEFEAHKQLLRRQRWEELRPKFEMQQKWDDDRERNFVFSLL